MTSLNSLINSIDERLAVAEHTDQSERSAPLFETQEKMRKYVLVHIDKEKLAIPIEGLSEIGPMPLITSLPNLPRWIYGIINQRGDIVSVISLTDLCLGKREAQMAGKKLAILRNGPMKVGICIDSVGATISRPESETLKSPEGTLHEAAPDTFGRCLSVEDTVYLILEPELFLTMDRLMQYYIAE